MRFKRYQVINRKSASKFRNVPTIVDGITFQSKAEAARYQYWAQLCQIGRILWFTRQVPFYLPGGVVYRADFLVVQAPMFMTRDPTPIIEDVTGVMTNTKLNKLKQVKAIYGVDVVIAKRRGKAGWMTEIVTTSIPHTRTTTKADSSKPN